ncbi:MAG: bifunctional diguanylate cyclase/phosphohydrolase [Solirubrobacteraceae bacterium]
MGTQARWMQRWMMRAGLAGLFVVLCVLAGFSLLIQRRVGDSARRANAANVMSALYQDARYEVIAEQSLVRAFRLSPDASILAERGAAESKLVADLLSIGSRTRSAAEKSTVDQLMKAVGVYDEVGYEIIQAVYAGDARLAVRLDKERGEGAFARVQAIVSPEAEAAQARASTEEAAMVHDTNSAKRAMVVAFALALGLIVVFGAVIARISSRLNRARAAEFATMARMASTDALTSLGNHRAFHEELARELRRASRGPTPMSLVMLDLDGLKYVNDHHGHQVGDERLRALANAIRSTHRAGDSAFRIGGDEFAVVLPGTRSLGALEFAQRISAALDQEINGATVTAGIAEALDAREKDVLIREADLALIGAKRIHQHAAIYTAELHADVGPEIGENEQHLRTLANALALAVDAKDSYTRSHCQTVSQLCVVVAAELGMRRDQLIRIRLAGLLHDVGKIGVPDSILKKPAALKAEEYEQMKLHSVLGEAIIEAAEMPVEARWVRHHHERVDGTGYPDRLAGTEIPLESRIIHVADAFEAMTSDRPYRPAPGYRYAIEELRRHSDTQFDREVVETLIDQLGPAGNLWESQLRAAAEPGPPQREDLSRQRAPGESQRRVSAPGAAGTALSGGELDTSTLP